MARLPPALGEGGNPPAPPPAGAGNVLSPGQRPAQAVRPAPRPAALQRLVEVVTNNHLSTMTLNKVDPQSLARVLFDASASADLAQYEHQQLTEVAAA